MTSPARMAPEVITRGKSDSPATKASLPAVIVSGRQEASKLDIQNPGMIAQQFLCARRPAQIRPEKTHAATEMSAYPCEAVKSWTLQGNWKLTELGGRASELICSALAHNSRSTTASNSR
jgi:hypothetical protein